MKNIFWLLALVIVSTSFTGCYTSFSPRDYEEEEYGKLNNAYYDSAYVAENNDSIDYYYPEEEYYDKSEQGLTIINNYSSSSWDLFPPLFAAASIYSFGYCNYYDPFYDPYYYPTAYYPYYGRYYGNNIYVYGDAYFNSGYYYSNFSPSPVRYRTTNHLYASIRNSGRRGIEKRERLSAGSRGVSTTSRSRFETVRGYDLDKDLTVSRIATNSRSRNSGNLRTASIETRNTGTKVKKVSDLERRRINTDSRTKYKTRKSIRTNDSRKQRVTKKQSVKRKNTTSNRSKRVYSSRSSGSRSSSSYYKSNRSTTNKRSSSSVSSSRRKSPSSYSSSRSSSRSSSSRSSYSRPSRSSSSRSSVSRPSSRSSSSSRSTSGRTSRRRR